MPRTTWNMANPPEYGFYSNVNPNVDHPRWSQETRAAPGRVRQTPDPDVQRLRRPGGQPVQRHGSQEELLSYAAQPLGQGFGVRAVPGAGGLARLARMEPGSLRQPDRVHHPLHRRLDAAIPGVHAGHHSAAQAAGPAGPDQVPPHDRAVRLLLRHAALHHLYLAGQVLRPGRHAARRRASGPSSPPASRRSC